MAKALLLTPFEARGLLAVDRIGFGTLIIGSEFCGNQLPAAELLRDVKKRFPAASLWLATSLLTDKCLAGWEKLLAALRPGVVSGTVFNDWGLLPALGKAKGMKLSAGRLLMRELKRQDPEWTAAYLRKRRVEAAEADTPELAAAARVLGLKVSSHRANTFTAVTTFCPFERHFRHLCAHSCEGKLRELSNKHLAAPLLLAEKAYFSPSAAGKRPGPGWREVVTLNFLPERRN